MHFGLNLKKVLNRESTKVDADISKPQRKSELIRTVKSQRINKAQGEYTFNAE